MSEEHGEEPPADPDEVAFGDPWVGVPIHVEATTEFPATARTRGAFCPAFTYRGRENWMARLSEESDAKKRAEGAQREVRALAARWLKMQNVCVLAGAGASQYATGFVGSGLFERVAELLEGRTSATTLEAILSHSAGPQDVARRFEAFLSELAAIAKLQFADDRVLREIRLDVQLAGVRGRERRRARIASLLTDIERAVAVACNATLPPSAHSSGAGEPTPHETFLGKLVARDPQFGRARVFTTNYDTLFEQAMDRIGVLYCDGFTGTVDRRFSPGAYDLDVHYPGDVTEGRVRRYDKVVLLYKLHGSIDWRRRKPSAGDPFGLAFRRDPLPTPEEVLAAEPGVDVLAKAGRSLAILPTAAKYAESLAMPFAHLFRAFGRALAQPQTVLLLIGYSGWDSHVNRLIEDALTNPGFTCVIVDPVPGAWAARLCATDYCGRVYCLGGEWGTFEFFARHVLPDLERLKTDLAIAKTLRELRSGPPSPAGGDRDSLGSEA